VSYLAGGSIPALLFPSSSPSASSSSTHCSEERRRKEKREESNRGYGIGRAPTWKYSEYAHVHTIHTHTHRHAHIDALAYAYIVRSGASNGTSEREFSCDNSLSFSFASASGYFSAFPHRANDSDVGGRWDWSVKGFAHFDRMLIVSDSHTRVDLFEAGNLCIYTLYLPMWYVSWFLHAIEFLLSRCYKK